MLGIHWRTRATGPQIQAMAQKSWQQNLTSADFWSDWVETQFGLSAGSALHATVSDVFESVDSFDMPLVVAWIDGPGKMQPKCYNMSQYAFVDTLENVDGNVTGAANVDRFRCVREAAAACVVSVDVVTTTSLETRRYWLQSFQYMRGIATTSCAWAEYVHCMMPGLACR